MSKTTIELNIRTIFGVAFVVIGLIILAYVSLTAFQLSTGAVTPLNLTSKNPPISVEMGTFLGIILQIGMFAILVVVASILLKFGLTLILQREKA